MQLFTLFFTSLTLCTGKQANGPGGLRGAKQEKPPFELLKELEEKMGKEHREATERKLHEYEKDLQGTFAALPKNEGGAIEAPSVRYALHRLFSQRYGWQIKGLENNGGAWDAASPIRAMDDHVLPQVRELFEERLDSHGLDLHELAVLAATMDNMFHKDVAKGIDIVLQASGTDRNVLVDRKGAHQIFIDYIGTIIMSPLHSDVQHVTAAHLVNNRIRFEKNFPRREEAKQALQDIVAELGAQSFDFDLTVSVMTEFHRRLARVEEDDCKAMKKHLLKYEQQPGNGRVRLADFYGDGSDYHFIEETSALREYGALDESNPNDLTVIIPNYLHSASNCVTPSEYYDICCLDECEAMMDHIEVQVAAPVVSPERIASVVTSLQVGRNYNRSGGDLPPILKRLLVDIADHHGGQVPLHGRLFAQWMHQAFPRECAHPRGAGDHGRLQTSTLVTSDGHTDEDRKYQEQLRSIVTNQTSETDNTPLSCWSWEEQLVDNKSHQRYISNSSHTSDDMPDIKSDIVFDIVACGVAVSIGSFLLRLVKGFTMKPRHRKDLDMS